jgi:hypothetical protein
LQHACQPFLKSKRVQQCSPPYTPILHRPGKQVAPKRAVLAKAQEELSATLGKLAEAQVRQGHGWLAPDSNSEPGK